MAAPIVFTWDGESMVPLRRFQRACDAEFTIGQPYQMVVQEERSAKTHAHYFAALHEGWMNLPDHQAERYPSVEHLRKFALIKTGFADSRQLVASSKAEAIRLAAFIRPLDEYSLVLVDGSVVTQWTAKSQSNRAMGKETFGASKKAVLEYVADLIGTTSEALITARAA